LDSNPMDFLSDAATASTDANNQDEEYMNDPEYQQARTRTRNSNFYKKYRKLHHELCDLVDDFGLLSFLPLSIQDAESVGRVVARIDKCNGYVFVKNDLQQQQGTAAERKEHNNMQDLFSSAIVADSEWGTGVLSDVQEKYLGGTMFREEISELKRT
jgi:predicted sugar kinase